MKEKRPPRARFVPTVEDASDDELDLQEVNANVRGIPSCRSKRGSDLAQAESDQTRQQRHHATESQFGPSAAEERSG